MKKILILAYDFPPYVSVGGLRPYAWYKYFKEFNLYPIVITRQWENEHRNHLDYISSSKEKKTIVDTDSRGTIIRTPYSSNLANRILLKFGPARFKLLRKSISAFYEVMQWFFPFGPKARLFRAANEYLKTNSVDYIIATGDPFILFKYANIISRRFNIPWIADYRDPWSNDFAISKKPLLTAWCSRFEKRIVKDSAFITTVSAFTKRLISSLFPDKDIHIVPNGYDPESFDQAANVTQTKEALSICFIGTIYLWNPVRQFLVLLSEYVSAHPEKRLRMNFYGINIESELQVFISQSLPQISSVVSFFPRLENKELMKKASENHLILLFNCYSLIGTKIYDYIALRRTILFCFTSDITRDALADKYYNVKDELNRNHSPQIDLINETNSGVIVRDREHFFETLSQYYKEFLHTGEVICRSTLSDAYSRKTQTKDLANLIHNALGGIVSISDEEAGNTIHLKRILILSYFYPPGNFAGSYRVESWAKHLHHFGYYPVVVTRRWDQNIGTHREMSKRTKNEIIHSKSGNYEVYFLPYKGNLRDRIYSKYGDSKLRMVRKVLSFLELFLQHFTSEIVPFSNLYSFSRALLKKEKFHLLIASGSPFILFRFSSELHKKTRVPWIADYRDEWTTRPKEKIKDVGAKLLLLMEQRSEKRWLANAEAILSVSEFWANTISSFVSKTAFVIHNGYEEEDFTNTIVENNSGEFRIVYNGSLYPMQPIDVFINAYKRIIDTYKSKIIIKLIFAGAGVDWAQTSRVQKLLSGYENYYEITERLPKSEIVRIQMNAQLLLMTNYAYVRGVHTSKLFEYLRCNKPIFFCPTDNGIIQSIIDDAGCGIFVSTENDAYSELCQLIEEYLVSGTIKINPRFQNIEIYSRKNQTKELAKVIDTLLEF